MGFKSMASNPIRSGFKRSALTVALGLCFAGTVHAQSTTGTVYGNAAPGETITLVSETGFARTLAVDSSGRYNASNLPVGNYTVTARKGDQVIGTKQVLVKVSSGTEASFAGAQAAPGNELGTITVTGSGAGIDVTQVDSRTVITSRDLAVLPIAHSAEAIALLAPGTVKGSSYFGSAVSFGGAGVTENAYYINGFNVSDPLANIGGLGLPYGSIAQQETINGGWSAMYGRSDGGVISQIGKRGSNDWHFGGQVTWRPKQLASTPKNIFYPTANLPGGTNTGTPAGVPWHYDNASLPGTLYRDRSKDKLWNITYDAYIGGPLVPNKLFFFLSAEKSKDSYVSTGTNVLGSSRSYIDAPTTRVYGKIDWNINDSNIFELTGIKENAHSQGSRYAVGGGTGTYGADGVYLGNATPTKQNSFVYIAKYTNYLSDNLNFSVVYGKNVVHNPTMLAVNSPLPNILNTQYIPAAYLPAGGLNLPQVSRNGGTPDARLQATGVRFDVEYRIGAHQLHGGIDNMTYTAVGQGAATSGPGYFWNYRSNGRNVRQYFFNTQASMSVVQKAIYLEDVWQVTDRILLKAGLRSDNFNNKNSAGQSYVQQKHQLAPRLGASWDLKGDSTMKLYGNVGRYYLALPSSVAIRGASPSTYYYQNYTYTGVDGNGQPTGLTYLPNPGTANGGYSGNNEFGQVPDPAGIAAKSLKPQYQDEGILGFDWQFSKGWIAGAKATYRKLGTVIDDWCDTGRVAGALPGGGADYTVPGCYIINPGRNNTFHVKNNVTGQYTDVVLTNSQLGFTIKPIRKYEALDLYLEHPFDGKWQARVDYTWSRNPGNTEGQIKSDIGQTDVSKTQDWDYAGLMVNSYGYMANDRRHSLRVRGMYQFAPEWLVTGKLLVQSGMPKSCLGYFYGDTDPIGYGSSYHTCNNQASPPGKVHGPWSKQLDLGLVYRPKYFDKKLSASLDVFNVTNDRKGIQYDPTFETSAATGTGDGTIRAAYGMPLFFQSPRYVQLSVSYDY